MKEFAPFKFLLLFVLIFNLSTSQAQCSYSGTPLTQSGATVTFCIDNIATVNTTSVNAGQYVLVNVVKGFNYTFSVGNVFGIFNENLTILNADTNVLAATSAYNSAFFGASITWTSTLSGQVKVLLSKGSCLNDNTTGGTVTTTLNSIGNTQDSQTAAGTNTWIGHVYNWTGSSPPGGASPSSPTLAAPFVDANYVGNYSIASETIAETFGGNAVCFPVNSNGANRVNIYTEQYAVRYRMRSTRTGCFMVTCSGDDGVRLYVDGVKVFDQWNEQSPTSYLNLLVYLNGNSNIVFDYYENGGGNIANFSLTPFDPTTNLLTATNTSVFSGNAPGIVTGTSYTYNGTAVNPTITYQWQSSTDNVNFTNIAGATAKDFTPTAITTPTTVVTYYRRVVSAAAANALACAYNSNVIAITTQAFSPCSNSSALTQVGSLNTFCVDNSNIINSPTVNAGQFLLVNVVKGFTYNFSVGNVFFTDTESLSILDAATNNSVGLSGFAYGNTGASLTWTASLSGQIKLVLAKGACLFDNTAGGMITMTLNSVGNTQDSQTAFGTDNWVGHVYNWTGAAPPGGTSPSSPTATGAFISSNYVGYYNVPTESFAEGFGGDYTCFPVLTNGVNRVNINTEQYAVRYRMRSTKTGCYIVNFSGDDGIRIYVDGVKIFDEWIVQAPTGYGNVLVYLNGNSDIVFDYFENGGLNVANFSLTPFVPSSNTVTPPATVNVCNGVSPGLLNGSSYVYNGATVNPTITFQWQSSTDNINFTNIAGATTEDYTPAGITATTSNVIRYYRRIVTAAATNASGCSSTSNTITIVTSPTGVPATPTSISGLASQCVSAAGQVYSCTTVTNAVTYNWTVPAGWTITAGAGTNSITVTAGTSGQNGNISVTASNGCGTSAARLLAVTVSSVAVAGTVSANQTICTGLQPANIRLTGSTGSIQWQSSTNNTSFTNISGATSATLTSATIGNLTVTTYYRAVVTVGVCSTVNTATVTVTVNPNTAITGQPLTTQTVCLNGASTALSVVAIGSALTYQWYSNTTNTTTGGTLISGAASASYTPLTTPAGTKYYYCIVTGSCGTAVTSTTGTVIVSPPSVAGTVSASQTICSGTQPANITLTGNTGAIQWQSSTDNVSFSNIVGATTSPLTSAIIGALTTTTYFRAVVTNSGCSSVNSSVVTVNITAIGTASTSQTICSGTQPASLTFAGYTGAFIWQTSTDNVNFANISGATTATLSGTTIGNLTATKYFRVRMTSGVCNASTSNVITITVTGAPTIASNTSAQSICINSTATLSANTPTVGLGSWSVVSGPSLLATQFSSVSNPSATFTPAGGVGNYIVRWDITNGTCGTSTADATITVGTLPIASITANNSPVCIGANAIFTLTGTAGAIVTYNFNGGPNSTTTLIAGMATVSIVASVPQTLNLVSISNGSCNQSLSGSSTVTLGTNQWFGGNGDWNVASNWTCGLIPTIDTPVVINSGVVIIPADAFSSSLTINGTATITVNSGFDLTVDGVLNVASTARLTVKDNANLMQNGTVNNNIGTTVTINKNSSALFRLDYELWSSPTSGTQTLANFSSQTSANRFYTYTSATDYYTANNGAIPFDVARGYLIRMPNNWIPWSATATPAAWLGSFNGKPNNGNISIGISTAGNGYNAVGNPYPSQLNVVDFLNYNIDNYNNIEGTLWFWRKTNDYTNPVSYSTCTLVGSAVQNRHQYIDDKKISVGQGFFVKAKSGASTVYFTNAMRISSNVNQFFKTTTTVDRFWLELKNADGVSFGQKLIAYVPDATLDYDTKYDGLFINDTPTALISMAGDKEVVIQARPTFDVQDVVHMLFKTNTAGNYVITLNQFEGVFATGQEILLRDNLTGTVHNMNTEGNYTFSSEIGTFNSRFDVIYQSPALGNNSNNFAESNVVVYDNNKTIHVKSNIEITKVKVFDIRGRLIIEKNSINSTEVKIDASRIANQVLLVQITSNEGAVVTKKVMN